MINTEKPRAAPTPATCVVVCYWTGYPLKNLFHLLDQMMSVDAGVPFSLVVVVNGGDRRPLTLPQKYAPLKARVINRVNHGYNIEAWDVGWRSEPHHDFYLFLQAECFLKKPGWLSDYEFRMAHDEGVGLLGEVYFWEEKTWQFIRDSTDRDLGDSVLDKNEPLHPIDAAKQIIQANGYPLTDLGSHISATIHFTSRKILEEVGGYPLFGPTYRHASASEIAFSRLIESKGYRLSRIRERDFSLIGHRQYTRAHTIRVVARRRVQRLLAKIGLRH